MLRQRAQFKGLVLLELAYREHVVAVGSCSVQEMPAGLGGKASLRLLAHYRSHPLSAFQWSMPRSKQVTLTWLFRSCQRNLILRQRYRKHFYGEDFSSQNTTGFVTGYPKGKNWMTHEVPEKQYIAVGLNMFRKQALPSAMTLSHYGKCTALPWHESCCVWEISSANMMQHLLLSSKAGSWVCHWMCHKTTGKIYPRKHHVPTGIFWLA